MIRFVMHVPRTRGDEPNRGDSFTCSPQGGTHVQIS